MTGKERAISVAEYAKLIDKTPTTVYKMIAEGKVKSEIWGKKATMIILSK